MRYPPFHLWLLASLLLVACTLEPPVEPSDPPPPAPPAEERVEPVLHDSQTPAVTETGSMLPIEHVLSGGILEIGDPSAPLTLLVFTEHHCRYCAEFAVEMLPQLTTTFVEAGSLKVDIVVYPLQKYDGSAEAAATALCAAEQGKGVAMHSVLFERAPLTSTGLNTAMTELEIDQQQLRACMASPETERALREQRVWAELLGVRYVPTFFLNGEKFVGLPEYADLRGRVEEALRAMKKK